MNKKYVIDCPKCGKEKSLTVSTWYYPATQYEPEDSGWDIDKQECNCDIYTDEKYDEKIYEAIDKINKEEAEFKKQERN